MIRLLFILLFIPAVAFSHELKPSIANFKFVKKADDTNFKLKIQLNRVRSELDTSKAAIDGLPNQKIFSNYKTQSWMTSNNN